MARITKVEDNGCYKFYVDFCHDRQYFKTKKEAEDWLCKVEVLEDNLGEFASVFYDYNDEEFCRKLDNIVAVMKARIEEEKLNSMLDSKEWRTAERSFERKVERARNYI